MNQDNLRQIKSGLLDTWDAIANDVLGIDESVTISKAAVIEMVMDADRVQMYGNCTASAIREWDDLSLDGKLKIANETFTYEEYCY